MTRGYADDVVTWQYPPPFDCYDMTGADPVVLADPASGFYAVLGAQQLVGLRSFGADGQVPGGSYDDSALDTGGGLRPDLVGHGLGYTAIAAGLAFGREAFRPAAFRVTVAAFNTRALVVLHRLGFTRRASFSATRGGQGYEIRYAPRTPAGDQADNSPISCGVASRRAGLPDQAPNCPHGSW